MHFSLPRLVLAASVFLLFGCASPREMLGWAADVPFALTEQELKEIAPVAPIFSERVTWVEFDKGKVCITCGDYSDTNGIGEAHVNARLNRDFEHLLERELGRTPLFPQSSAKKWSIFVYLVALDQQSSVGAQAERKSVISSGAVLTTKITLRYELVDEAKRLLDSWTVTTTARSNSLAASTRLTENIDSVLKRNLRAFLLRVVVDHSPPDAERARAALIALNGEVDNKRIALGSIVYGATKTVTTTTGLIGDGIVAVAKNPDAVAAGLNSSLEGSRRIEAASRGSSLEQDQAKARRSAEFNARIAAQQEDPDSDLNKNRRAQQAQQSKARQAESVPKIKPDAARQAKQGNEDRSVTAARTQESDNTIVLRREQQGVKEPMPARDPKAESKIKIPEAPVDRDIHEPKLDMGGLTWASGGGERVRQMVATRAQACEQSQRDMRETIALEEKSRSFKGVVRRSDCICNYFANQKDKKGWFCNSYYLPGNYSVQGNTR